MDMGLVAQRHLAVVATALGPTCVACSLRFSSPLRRENDLFEESPF